MAVSVLLVPVPAAATVATFPVPAVEEISVGVQWMSVAAQHSSEGKKAPVPKSKAAGGKVPKQTRASKPGMTLSVGRVELSGDVSGPVDVPVVEDSFLVRLPGGEEYVIPGRCDGQQLMQLVKSWSLMPVSSTSNRTTWSCGARI